MVYDLVTDRNYMRTLTLQNLEHKSNGPFVAGEDMVSFRQGKEIRTGQKAYLLDGHVCLSEKDAIDLHNELNAEDLLE